MKNILILLSLLFILPKLCIGQSSEFNTYSNGLIYSDSTMVNLKRIVDSLNLKFAHCERGTTFLSKQQALAYYVEIKKFKVKEAKKDIENNISIEDFILKYPDAFINDSLLVLKYKTKNSESADAAGFRSVEISGNDQGHEITVPDQDGFYSKPMKGKWVLYYYEGSGSIAETLTAFYFITEFESRPIPEEISKLINYSICLIDTNVQIKKAPEAKITLPDSTNSLSNISKLMNYINEKTNKPVYEKYENGQEYFNALQRYDSLKFSIIDTTISKQSEFHELLKKAVDEAFTRGGSNDEFEKYVGRYYSKKAALDLKLGRSVVGNCSLDGAPRFHSLDIALLSAETADWEIFLRAHLDIMNDKFDRVSDGSWSWGERKTYLKELEELGIKTVDLLTGISFSIENPCKNQYFGDVSRIGRALAESIYRVDFENKIMALIKNRSLDDYNRIAMYYLFLSYEYNISDSVRQLQNKDTILKTIGELPSYISKRIFDDQYEFKRLLRNEADLLDNNFEITDSHFGSVGSIDWDFDDGDCWMADLKPKNSSDPVQFSVTMANNEKPGSIKPVLAQKDSLLIRVHKAKFLIDLLQKYPGTQLEINFTIDHSFSKKAQAFFREYLPDDLKKEYEANLDDIVFVSLTNIDGWSRWLIFPNNEVMLWQFSGKLPLEQYTEEELNVKDRMFKSSFKRFNPEGKVVN